jgi:diguanylate cyclase
LLREISRRLTTGLRCSDVTSRFYEHVDRKADVARLGGDEFTILLNELNRPEDAAVVAQRINAWIAKPIMLGERQAHIGVSMGITVFPFDGEDSETLLKNADMAMYHAKKLGKGNYQFFQESMAQRARKRLEMESYMNLAVQRNELFLHFQPVIECSRENLVGAEALLRWQSHELGFMSPNDFISLAEENGMINQFGEWVIRNVCRQHKIWQDQRLGELNIAINLSCMQFNQPGFIPMIADVVREHQVNPGNISFELTESMIMLDTDNMLEKLKKLKDLGFKLSIDDFGTGYSSLSYLKRFPLDFLKIDRAFIKDLPGNKDSIAIVRAILALAKALNLKTVAEGVETEEQKQFLVNAECDAIQGYFFSKPLPCQDFESYWLKKNLVIH